MKTYKLSDTDGPAMNPDGSIIRDKNGNPVMLRKRDREIILGKGITISGKECLAQRLKNAITLDEGSWFLNPSKGFPWFGLLGTKSVSKRVVYSEIQKIITADREVDSINYLDINFDRASRNGEIKFSINSIYGEVQVTV